MTRKIFATFLFCLIVFGCFSVAFTQQEGSQKESEGTDKSEEEVPKKDEGVKSIERYFSLKEITLNFSTKTISWKVSNLEKDPKTGEFIPKDSGFDFEIDITNRAMISSGKEARRFSKEEQNMLFLVLSLNRGLETFLKKYTLESSLWWAQGSGEEIDLKNLEKPENHPSIPLPSRKGADNTSLAKVRQ